MNIYAISAPPAVIRLHAIASRMRLWTRALFSIIISAMKISTIIQVAGGVLKNPFVIGAAVAVILYLNFVFYVARYKKHAPRPKKVKRVEKPAEPAPAKTEENAEE